MANYLKKRRLKRISLLVVIAAIILTICFTLLVKVLYKHDSDVMAIVDGEEVYKSEIKTKFQSWINASVPGVEIPDISNLPAGIIESLAKDVYVEKKILKNAKISRIHKDKNVQKEITDATNNIIIKNYIQKVSDDSITDEKVANEYMEMSNNIEGKMDYKISHILFKDEADAKRIYNELKADKNKFENYAEKYSIDANTAKAGGDVGFVMEDKLPIEFVNILKNIKKGEISKPVKTKFGWHIVKFVDVKESELPSLENMKETIKAKIRNEFMRKYYKSLSKDIKVKLVGNIVEKGDVVKNNSKSNKSEIPKKNKSTATDKK